MSDELVGRYRRVYVRIWDDPKFRALSPNEQRLTLYLLSGPQTNRIGLFKFSVPRASEDLNLGIESVRKAFANVCLTFGWVFDAEARVFYMPSWWRWNCSVNTNILIGNLKDLSEIPSCALVEAFARNTAYIPPNVLESFTEALRKRLPKLPEPQEQVARSEKLGARNEKSTALRAAPLRGEKKEGFENGLVPIAKTVVKLTGRNASMQDLYDTFRSYHRDDSLPKADIIEALNIAVMELRPS